MSFLKRSLNLIKGSISLIQKSDQEVDQRNIRALEKELAQPMSPPQAVTNVGKAQSMSEIDDKPLKPKKRTI